MSFIAYQIKKLVVQKIMVKTASRSDRPWSAIFCESSIMSFNSYQVAEGRVIGPTNGTTQFGSSPHLISGQYYVQVNENNVQFITSRLSTILDKNGWEISTESRQLVISFFFQQKHWEKFMKNTPLHH